MPLKVSFCICTYNASRHIGRCLNSIVRQDYPPEKIEILVSDGGSTDGTMEIVKSFGIQPSHNERRLYDFGAKINASRATGDLFIIFAADNELIGMDWLNRVSQVFERHPDLSAFWGGMRANPKDAKINGYYELIQSDPLTNYLNQNLKSYLRSSRLVANSSGAYHVFNVDPSSPLVWGANGLVYRLSLVRDIILDERFLADNDVFQMMVEMGHNLVAYAPSLAVYHHHLTSLKDWVGKWKRNYEIHLSGKLEERNMNWTYTPHIIPKLAFWGLYSLIPIVSLAHAIYRGIEDRNVSWFYHPGVSFLQTVTLAYLMMGSRRGGMTFRKLTKIKSHDC